MKLTPAQAYLRKVKRKPAKSESSLQGAIVKACRGYLDGVVRGRFSAIQIGCHVPGISQRQRMLAGSTLKREGARAGVPDMIFWGPDGRVLWVEVKLGTQGRLSDAQQDVHRSLGANGHTVIVARDLAEAIKAVLNFYGREGR